MAAYWFLWKAETEIPQGQRPVVSAVFSESRLGALNLYTAWVCFFPPFLTCSFPQVVVFWIWALALIGRRSFLSGLSSAKMKSYRSDKPRQL